MQTDTNGNSTSYSPAAAEFAVSDSAADRIAALLADEPEGTVFRVSVLGGGCSGFQYHFELDAKGTTDEDTLIRHGSATVVVDAVSLELVKGALLDYVEQMVGAAFEIKNPNAKMGCGCGNSFSV